MKKETEEKLEKKNSLRTFIIFCVIVTLVIAVSLVYRIFLLTQQSKFDGKSSIIISLMQENKKKAAIYAVDPTKKTMSLLVLKSDTELSNLRKNLGIPIEGEITQKSISETAAFPFLMKSSSFFSPPTSANITILDVFRLWFLGKTLPERQKKVVHMQITKESTDLDEESASLFIDSQFENDKQTIIITNGTAISGLGSRLEKQITRIGGNVINITTSHAPIQASRILYSGEPSYSVRKLQRITHFPAVMREEGGISDILVEIGEDQQRTEAF